MVGVTFGQNLSVFFAQIIILSILIEAIVRAIIDPESWKSKPNIIATLVGYGIATIVVLNTRIGIFTGIGFQWAIPIVDWLLTGIVLSRGSNYVSDIIKRIKGVSDGLE